MTVKGIREEPMIDCKYGGVLSGRLAKTMKAPVKAFEIPYITKDLKVAVGLKGSSLSKTFHTRYTEDRIRSSQTVSTNCPTNASLPIAVNVDDHTGNTNDVTR